VSADREVTRIVRSWLEEGVNALPDRVLDNVLDQIPATRQRRPWWPAWRLPYVNTQIRVAIAAAAVVIVAVIGINVLPRTGITGPAGPGPSPTPAPTLPAGSVPPGTYRAGFLTYTLPAGWTTDQAGIVTILKGNANPPNGMAVDLWRIATVYSDPCHSQTKPAPALINPTVDQLVAAFVAQKRSAAVTPIDVTIGGFHGKQIDLVVPADVKFSSPSIAVGCEGGQYKPWTDADGGDRYNQGPGQHDLLDILDVSGQTQVIMRAFYAANTPADLAELQAIVDSVTITP
jgi:hypothetical protein